MARRALLALLAGQVCRVAAQENSLAAWLWPQSVRSPPILLPPRLCGIALRTKPRTAVNSLDVVAYLRLEQRERKLVQIIVAAHWLSMHEGVCAAQCR